MYPGFGVLTMVSQMGSQMSVSEADQEWSEWSVRFEKLLVTGWSVSPATEWHTDSGQMLVSRVPSQHCQLGMPLVSYTETRAFQHQPC